MAILLGTETLNQKKIQFEGGGIKNHTSETKKDFFFQFRILGVSKCSLYCKL